MVENSELDRFLAALGGALAEARQAKGQSQSELAHHLGKQQPAIAKLENSLSRSIGVKVLFEVAEKLDIRLSELFARAEERAGVAVTSTKSSESKRLAPKEAARISKLVAEELNRAHMKIVRQLTDLDKVN